MDKNFFGIKFYFIRYEVSGLQLIDGQPKIVITKYDNEPAQELVGTSETLERIYQCSKCGLEVINPVDHAFLCKDR